MNETVTMEILQTLKHPLQNGCYDDLVQYSTFGSLCSDVLDNVQQRTCRTGMYMYMSWLAIKVCTMYVLVGWGYRARGLYPGLVLIDPG